MFPDAQELLSALASIKVDSNKGLADFTFSEGGFTVLSVNTACSFQTSVFLSRKLFEQYRMAEDVCQMSLELGTLIFTLRLFISADADVGIVMQYPGPNQELIVKSNNHSSPPHPSDPSIEPSMNTQYQNEKFLPTLFARIETASAFGGSANLIEHMGGHHDVDDILGQWADVSRVCRGPECWEQGGAGGAPGPARTADAVVGVARH